MVVREVQHVEAIFETRQKGRICIEYLLYNMHFIGNNCLNVRGVVLVVGAGRLKVDNT